LRELSLEWHEGERLLLLGPSGSGKSTLALCLDGVIPHALDAHWEHGRVVIAGRDTREAGLGELTRTVGVLFQDPETQLTMLEVDDEIAFGLENLGLGRDEMRSRVLEARALTGLDRDGVPYRIDELSGGTKQRVTLAALLAMRPRALVLDEPTANLDPDGTREVLAAVRLLVGYRSRSLLLIEHRLDDVLSLVDRVAVLDERGSLALAGTPEEVFVGAHARLDALGVWVPQLRELARCVGSEALPRDVSAAADLLVERWPIAASPPRVMSPLGETLVVARDAGYRYRRDAAWAVRDASLEIRRGEFVALVGPNGAGKSTLGLLLAGAVPPTRGAVERRARVGFVFQYPEHQFVARTVADELRASGVPDLDALLVRIGLSALGAANPFTLSHGEKRRLSVATALASGPDVLVLDEPTFGQDRRHNERLLSELGALNGRGVAVVIITHDLAFVADHARRVLEVRDGRVTFDGATADYFARVERLPPVAEAFRLAHARRPQILPLLGLAAARAALTG